MKTTRRTLLKGAAGAAAAMVWRPASILRLSPAEAATGWTWHESILDAMGGTVTAWYDDASGQWFLGADIGGRQRVNVATDGIIHAYNAGTGVNDGGAGAPATVKAAAMRGDGRKLIAACGTAGTGNMSRRLLGDAGWFITASDIGLAVDGPIADPRAVGSKRVAIDGTNVYAGVIRNSDKKMGLARSLDDGATWPVSGRFGFMPTQSGNPAGDRRYTSLHVATAPTNADVLYATASVEPFGNPQNAVGDARSAGVFVILGASTTTPSWRRIDTAQTFKGAQSAVLIRELGQDVLYVVVSTRDTVANQGVWRAVIGNPGSSTWAPGQVAWSKISNGLSGSDNFVVITGRRNAADTRTQLIVGNTNPSQVLAGTNPGSGKPFLATHYRTLDASAPIVPWDPITAGSNVHTTVFGTGGVGQPPAEDWVLFHVDAAVAEASIGGSGYTSFDLSVGGVGDHDVVASGKSGFWLTQNPWDQDPRAVAWYPLVQGDGGVSSNQVAVHPTDPLKVIMSDIDRSAFTWATGGVGQPRCHEPAISDGANGTTQVFCWFVKPDGTVIGGREGNAYLRNSNPWAAGGGTWTKDAVTSTTAAANVMGVAELADSTGATVRLAAATGNSGIHRRVGTTSWRLVLGTPVSKNDEIFFYVVGQTVYVQLANGVFRSIDAGLNWQSIFPRSTSGGFSLYGRLAQDSSDPHRLYVSFGPADGLWIVVNANDGALSASGGTVSGTIHATRSTQSGVLSASSSCGAMAVDSSTGDVVVTLVADDPNGPDILLSSARGASGSWMSIADTNYRESAVLPLDVAKAGSRTYVGTAGQGVYVGTSP